MSGWSIELQGFLALGVRLVIFYHGELDFFRLRYLIASCGHGHVSIYIHGLLCIGNLYLPDYTTHVSSRTFLMSQRSWVSHEYAFFGQRFISESTVYVVNANMCWIVHTIFCSFIQNVKETAYKHTACAKTCFFCHWDDRIVLPTVKAFGFKSKDPDSSSLSYVGSHCEYVLLT